MARQHPSLRRSSESGQAALEFAVTLPIILLMLMGVIYFGKVYYIDQSARHAVRYVAWKAARHGSGELSQAENGARQSFTLASGATFSGSSGGSTLDEVGMLTSEIFDDFGDPDSLPSEFNLSGALVDMLVAAGLSAVATSYHASVEESYNPDLLTFLGGTSIRRDHYVAYADWPKDEINGDAVILAFEAVLDAWAYDNITNM